MRDGKQPLDRGRAPTPGRAAAYVDIQRREGETLGAKQRAMVARPRAEDGDARAARFVALAREGAEG